VRAAVFRGAGRLATEEWPRPRVGPGELLVRVRGCGLCGSDIAKILAPATPTPAVFGHEVVGEVIEAGPGIAEPKVGDRVVVAHHVPCGTCHYCRRGSHSMCPAFKASNLDPGGFAEYVRVPVPNVAHATFVLPAHVDDEAASFVEPLACCLRALRRAGVQPDDTVAVVGLGSIGHLFARLLRLTGAAVVGVDAAPARRTLARGFGVDALAPEAAAGAIRKRSDGRGADHVILTGGAAQGLKWGASVVRDGGSLHCFAGGPEPALPLDLDALYHRELTVTATYSSSPRDLAEAFRLVAGGAIVLDGLYTHRVPLDRLDEGVQLMRSQDALKVYVTT
jgi:L-iditol 2-dehydrogenase